MSCSRAAVAALAAVVALGASGVGGCRCQPADSAADSAAGARRAAGASKASRAKQTKRAIPLRPPPREPGPPREEKPGGVAAARREAESLVSALLEGGISRREVTAMADIRGYRLYRKRYFRRARAWFEIAVRTDPSFELSRYNAARAAALTGDLAGARRHLRALRALGTPLSRHRMELAKVDPDLAALRAWLGGGRGAEPAAGHRRGSR